MLGSGGGAAPGLDLSAVLQLAVVGLVLLSAAFAALRRAASRYFVVDAAGFAASYEDHHHGYTPPPARVKQEDMSSAGGEKAPCAECRRVATKKCTGCKRVRYCSQECQSKHWRADHKFKCKQMKLLDPADKLCRDEAKKSSGFGPISLVPAHGKGNKILFPYDEFLKLYNWKDLNFGPCGLVNCGNSCFANVVLQCLSCTRPLVAYLLGKDHSRECARRHGDWCFLCELQRHIQRASESLHPFAPMNILSHLPNIGGNLGFGRQEDAHEFMRFAIDKMQSACLNEFGGEKAVDLITQETTLIQHMFGGRLQSQVQCTACGMVSNRYDNMMDLTVEIQGDAESLEECLDQFTAVEWLDGDNKYKCDGCNDYVKARKRLTVHQAPNILTITLKRFQSGRFGKLNKRITFPMELDLRPYMSSTDGSDLYELYAVVVHLDMMNASFFGHYICYTKDYQGRWYRIDDCKVMTIDEDEVLAQGAYMLLYNRITARPRPLIAPEEPPKQQQQCQVLPLNGQNHLNSIEEASSNGEASSKYLKDSLPEDSRIDNESSHKLDVMYRESAMDLHNDTEGQKPAMNENLQGPDLADMPSSSALDVLEEPNYVPDSLLKCSKMSKCLGSSTGEASSVPFSSEQCQEPGASSDSVDYMEVDTDASTAIEKWNDQTPELDYSIGRMDDRTRNSTLDNVSARKPKELLSRGFLDRLPRKKSSFGEDRYQLGNGVASSQELNGYSNGHRNSQQEYHTNSFTCNTSSGMAECNGGLFPTSNNGIHSFSNGGNKSSSDSSPAESLDVPFVSRGLTPRPYRGTSGGSMNRNKTNGGTLLVGDNNNYFRNSPADDCHGDMSFLHRGFLERPCTREQSVRDNDNGTLSFVNGNGKSTINPSAGDDKGGMPFFSPGFLTRRYRESSVMGTSTSSVHDQKTRSNISSEQAPLGAAEYVDQTQERWSSDCMTNGRESQHKASINGNGSSHHGENGHAILESNMIPREVNNGDVTPDANSSNYQKDDGSAMLVSGEYMGSENVDQLKFLSRKVLDHEGLRRRLTVKFPEQNGIDAQ